MCVVAKGVCLVAGGHTWLGACVVAGGHVWLWGGMYGCQGGMHGCRGAVVVAGGGCGCWGVCRIRRDTVNERAVRILLEYTLV